MRTALILLAGLLPITGIAGQESSTRSLVEGPTETATVVVTTIDYRNDPTAPWTAIVPPLSPGGSTAARLRTDLPLTIGAVAIQPGSYNLWLQSGSTLTITRMTGDQDGFSSDDVVGSVELEETRDSTPVAGWTAQVVSVRVSDASVSMREDRSSPGLVVIHTNYSPGTRSFLRLAWRDRRYHVEVKAR
jgi:hypothetical protein